MSAEILSIHIASGAGLATFELDEAELVAGKGIIGDRNYRDGGADPARQVTLIESEQIERFNREHDRDMGAGVFRRNLVTRGIDLNEMVGKRFHVGAVLLEGMELCQPCATLGRILSDTSLSAAQATREFLDRGGLRARIISGGRLSPGEHIGVEDAAQPGVTH